MAEQKELLLKIKADLSQASKEIRRLQKELKGVGDDSDKSAAKMKKGIREATKDMDSLTQAYKRAGNAVKSFGRGAEATFQKLASVQGVITGALIKGFNDMAIAEEKLKMQTQALRANPAFGGIQKDFKNISNLTGGLVNDFEMVSGVSKAMAFGLDLSNGRLAKMVQGAHKASIAMGTDLGKAFEDLTVAGGRQSKMIADNLGIVMSVKEANENFAAALGITTGEMTEQQKKTAFLEEMLNKLDKAYSHIDTKNFDTRIQKNTKTIEKYIKVVKEGATNLLADTISDGEEIGGRIFDLFEYGISGAHRMWAEQEALAIQTKENNKEQEEWANHLEKTNLALDAGYSSISDYEDAMKAFKDETKEAKKALFDFNSEMVRGSGSGGGLGAPASISPKRAKKFTDAVTRKKKKDARKAQRAAEKARQEEIRKGNQMALLETEKYLRGEAGLLDEKKKIHLDAEIAKLIATSDAEKIQIDLDAEKKLRLISSKEEELKIEREYQEDLRKIKTESDQAMNDLLDMNRKFRDDERQRDIRNAEKDAEEQIKMFQVISSNGLGIIKQMATESAETVLLSIGEMAAGFAWSAGSQMVADGIAGNAKAAVVATWPFVGPALAAPMFAASNSAIAGGLGLMAAGGLGTFMTAQAGASSTGGSSSDGAQERNTTAEPEDTTIYVQSTLYPNKTTFQKEFKRNGIDIKT